MQEIVPNTPQPIMLEVKLHDTCVVLNILSYAFWKAWREKYTSMYLEKCE